MAIRRKSEQGDPFDGARVVFGATSSWIDELFYVQHGQAYDSSLPIVRRRPDFFTVTPPPTLVIGAPSGGYEDEAEDDDGG
jgi:hypothetical protein